MITKTFETTNGAFQIIFHSKTSVALRNDKLIINKIPYMAHTCYDVQDGILTENYRYISRIDSFTKEATYEQKNRACEVMKREAFDYVFSYRELLEEAEIVMLTNKLLSLKEDERKAEKEHTKKQEELALFWAENCDKLGDKKDEVLKKIKFYK